MKNLTKLIGFTAILCTVNPSFADMRVGDGRAAVNATNRLGVTSSVAVGKSPSAIAAARRLPTMKYVGATTTTTTSSSSSSLMTEVECVDAYSECIRSPEACGPDFEECTTNELFYAKKPQCNSVLLQCTSAGINTLFGTTNTAYVSVENMDTYPTAGSIVGQFIAAGEINNRLDTSSCVKRYMSCLKKDNVCGETFELCTTNNEFKKQKIYCESTLARCQDEGKIELFGRTDTSQNPTDASRLGVQIAEGAELASQNAVNTCYKVANQCLLSACTANPYRCIVDSSAEIIAGVDNINEGNTAINAADNPNDVVDVQMISTSDVTKYLRNSCAETIGGNKYCFMTVKGRPQTARDMADEETRDEVYSDIYSSVMNSVLRERIQKLAEAFDTRTKNACSDSLMACAMRSCGGGLGSACFQKVYGTTNNCFTTGFQTPTDGCTINGDSTYDEIKIGCEAIVNTDANCQYAAASVDNNLTYSYNYTVDTAFSKLFPKKSDNAGDPIGVVTRLNASLAENYSPAAIEALSKECRLTATSCIRSMCGTDFTKCYRNRTDVMTNTYATDEDKFNQSMNKVGGVLDFTIVRGLCVAMVKGSDACDEHFKIQQVRNYSTETGAAGWGQKKTVRDAWVDAVSDGYRAEKVEVDKFQDGCTPSGNGASGTGGSMSGTTSGSSCDINDVQPCGTVDEMGCLYNTPHYVSIYEYQLNMEVNTLFQEVMADLELEAQAKYNAKITEEQNMCIAANSGGIMGKKDMSSTYQWVKLKNRKVPKYYPTSGLKTSDFTASNELYGSFCRARVTIQSDDPEIQAVLQKGPTWSTAYFAVGDVFTCGSWISQKDLETISTRVACKKAQAEGKIDRSVDCRTANEDTFNRLQLTNGQKWGVAGTAIGGALLGGAGGAYLADAVQNSNLLGGLIQRNRNTDKQNSRNMLAASDCRSAYSSYTAAISSYNTSDSMAKSYTDGNGDVKSGKKQDYAKQIASTTTASGNARSAVSKMRSAASLIVNTERSKKNEDSAVAKFETARSGLDSACSDPTDNNCQNAMANLAGMCDQVYSQSGQLADYDDNTRRQTINLGGAVLGAAGVGITGAFAVRDAIRAGNQRQFTEAEQEFMNNVGSHIYCFIGAEEAGTYGDLIEISVD